MDGKNSKGASRTGFFKKLLITFLIIDVVAVVFVFALFHLIPGSLYERLLAEELLQKAGLRYERASFSTAFPMAFRFEGLKLYDRAGGELVALDSLKAGLSPFGHAGGLKISIEGLASGGQLTGVGRLGFFGSSLEMEARGVGFNAIRALERAGVKLDGTFDAMLVSKSGNGCPKGSLKLQSVEIKSGEFAFRGLPLPIDDIDEAGLSAEFMDCRVRVDGLWMDGRDLSARVKGALKMASPIEASTVDMVLELMPNEGLREKEFLLNLIQQYRKSTNYYSIPLKGTLGRIEAGQ